MPESGDTVQVMKAGLLEIADLFVVNKADREGAVRMKTELQTMLSLRVGSGGEDFWEVPVLLTEARNGKGTEEILNGCLAHHERPRRRGTEPPSRTTPA